MATLCINCGSVAHRSKSRTATEVITKYFSGHKIYRCHRCEWRGRVVEKKIKQSQNRLRTVLLFVLVLVITVICASFMVERMTNKNPPNQPVTAR